MITSGPLIPIWVTAPIAFILMVGISAHAASLRRSSAIPASRKRIRQANAWLSVLTLGLLLAGFSLINPNSHQKLWMLVWIAAMLMLLMVITLAIVDVGNTMRLAMRWRRSLRDGMARKSSTTGSSKRPSSDSPAEVTHERS